MAVGTKTKTRYLISKNLAGTEEIDEFEQPEEEESPRLSRQERLARRFRSCLYCEWCNRCTVVPFRRWKTLYDQERLYPRDYIYFCPRERCKLQRSEYLTEKDLPSGR